MNIAAQFRPQLPCSSAFAQHKWRDVRNDVLVAVAAVLIFPKDYFISVFKVHSEAIGIGLLFVLAFYVLITQSRQITLRRSPVLIFLTLLFAWTGSMFWQGLPNTSSYYAAFIVALMIGIIQPKNFLRSMAVIMTVNTGLEVYEAVSNSFVYAYVGDGIEYDETIYSTRDGALRVKGLFAGPLNPIGILMSLALLTPRSTFLWTLLCVSSALGQGRLGLSVGVAGLIVSTLLADAGRATALRRVLNLIALLVSLTVVIVVFIFFGTDDSIQRFLEIASSNNSQNQSRLYFWRHCIDEISNYDLLSHLFGRFGYIKAKQGATESDWFRMWLDNGVICLLVYIVLLVGNIARALLARRWLEVFSFVTLAVVMGVYPHAQSLPNGILVWIMLLSFPQQEPS
jgi:hypothetical protein